MNYQNNNSISKMNTTGETLTTGVVQFYPYTQPWNGYPTYNYLYTTVQPTECSGDIHVFPCAKCGDCKCGKAKLAKGTKR